MRVFWGNVIKDLAIWYINKVFVNIGLGGVRCEKVSKLSEKRLSWARSQLLKKRQQTLSSFLFSSFDLQFPVPISLQEAMAMAALRREGRRLATVISPQPITALRSSLLYEYLFLTFILLSLPQCVLSGFSAIGMFLLDTQKLSHLIDEILE